MNNAMEAEEITNIEICKFYFEATRFRIVRDQRHNGKCAGYAPSSWF